MGLDGQVGQVGAPLMTHRFFHPLDSAVLADQTCQTDPTDPTYLTNLTNPTKPRVTE